MLTGEVKGRLIEVLSEIVERHQRARAAVTEEVEPLVYPYFCSVCCCCLKSLSIY